MAFLESLRLANIFPTPKKKPLGMPDLDIDPGIDFRTALGIALDERDKDRRLQMDLNRKPFQPHVREKTIPEKIIDEKLGSKDKPKNIIFQDSMGMSPKERAQFDLEKRKADIQEKNAESLAASRASQSDIGQQRADAQKMNAETSARIASLRDLPDSEKLKLLQEGRISVAELNASSSMDRVNRSGELASKRQEVSGAQRMKEIGERLAGQKDMNTERIDAQRDLAADRITAQKNKPISNTQQRVGLANKAQRLMNQRPDLAEFIAIDDKGNVNITAEEGTVEHNMINGLLYGEDVELSPESNPKSSKKATKAPVGKSKYSVTIE